MQGDIAEGQDLRNSRTRTWRDVMPSRVSRLYPEAQWAFVLIFQEKVASYVVAENQW
eukprot:COSAG02_NODE_13518_length_1384_cov_0.655253_3_plen_56_part_01